MTFSNFLLTFFNRVLIFVRKLNIYVSKKGSKKNIKKFDSIEGLFEFHFQPEPDHINRPALFFLLNTFKNQQKEHNLIILETGSSAHGTNSTVLFDFFINSFCSSILNKKLLSCDIRINPLIQLRNKVSPFTTLYVDDSVHFLKTNAVLGVADKTAFLIYLDSFDLDWNNPVPSALHGLNEFVALFPLLKTGTLIAIDDTPVDLSYCISEKNRIAAKIHLEKYGLMPGKGMYVDLLIKNMPNIKKIFHQYMVIYKVE